MSKVLMIEFNEICSSLIARWSQAGLLPNFSRLRDQSQVYDTVPDIEDPEFLEPWIQWYSIHTGLPFAQHGVFHLTDGPRAGHPDIWSILRAAGRSVACAGSMNARAFRDPDGFFLPDPWCTSEAVDPPQLAAYQHVVATLVREYTNTQTPLTAADYARFLGFLASHGLKPGTVARILAQLARERLVDPRFSWRRASLLESLQFDVFKHYYRRRRPDFTTFFANSVAHLQHSYWRNMAPEAFLVRPGADEQAVYGDAIRDGYRVMDRLLGDLMDCVGDDTSIILVSALSQQPFLRHEGRGGQHFYRPHDVRRLLGALSITPQSVQPTMTHQFMLTFGDAQTCARARERLQGCRFANRPLFDLDKPLAPDQLYFCNALSGEVDLGASFEDTVGGRTHRLGDFFYLMDAVKSGCHHPQGLLWIRSARHDLDVSRQQVSILDILPTVLSLMQVPAQAGLIGRPLVRETEPLRRAA
ncbi:MAG: alkaline phosphatase family protein [Burkholderiaceae bacterium]